MSASPKVPASLFKTTMTILAGTAIMSDSVSQISSVMSSMTANTTSALIQSQTSNIHGVLDAMISDDDVDLNDDTRTRMLFTIENIASAFTSRSNLSQLHHRRNSPDLASIQRNIDVVDKLSSASMKETVTLEQRSTETAGSMTLSCVKKPTGPLMPKDNTRLTVGIQSNAV
eukprot:PhF_6_TR27909/c0_g1_i2/m.40961